MSMKISWKQRLGFLVDGISGLGVLANVPAFSFFFFFYFLFFCSLLFLLNAIAFFVFCFLRTRVFAFAPAHSSWYQERKYAFGGQLGFEVGRFWHRAHLHTGFLFVCLFIFIYFLGKKVQLKFQNKLQLIYDRPNDWVPWESKAAERGEIFPRVLRSTRRTRVPLYLQPRARACGNPRQIRRWMRPSWHRTVRPMQTAKAPKQAWGLTLLGCSWLQMSGRCSGWFRTVFWFVFLFLSTSHFCKL